MKQYIKLSANPPIDDFEPIDWLNLPTVHVETKDMNLSAFAYLVACALESFGRNEVVEFLDLVRKLTQVDADDGGEGE